MGKALQRESQQATSTNHASFWRVVKTKNMSRMFARSGAKLLGVIALLVAGRFQEMVWDLSAAFPSTVHILLFTSWYGAMGLSDELDDLPSNAQTRLSRAHGKLSQLFMMAPIPYLMMADPSLYVSFAAYQLASHTLSNKIDTRSFQVTAALGTLAMFLVCQLRQVTFPVTGLIVMIMSNVLWQIHDEHPMLIRFNNRFPNIAPKLWNLFSFHTIMILLVMLRVLPLSWLTVTSASYATSKLGLSHGYVSQSSRQEILPTTSMSSA